VKSSQCPKSDRCSLRATCKVLSEHADPIVFRRLSLYHEESSPHITEHQIISLATLSSKACEFTREMQIRHMPNDFHASEQSWPHFGHCDNLKVHLPTAMSRLRNMTSFTFVSTSLHHLLSSLLVNIRWVLSEHDPDWLINSLMQAVSQLPQLTKLDVSTAWGRGDACFPLGLFANLTTILVHIVRNIPSFVSEMSTVLANSPQLKSLTVSFMETHEFTLGCLFAKIPTKNPPICLEHLSICNMDVTLDEVVLPHLRQLTSFRFTGHRLQAAHRVWTSFLVHNVKLLRVFIDEIRTEEMINYLSSFSGLKSLVVIDISVDATSSEGYLKDMLLSTILPKHVNSLQTLAIFHSKWVKLTFILFHVIHSLTRSMALTDYGSC
jgi:hypothetical protein